MNKLPYLQVKLDSLAAEARIIRRMERRKLTHARHARGWYPIHNVKVTNTKDGTVSYRTRWSRYDNPGTEQFAEGHMETYFSLHRHRTLDLRREARASHLAYGFLRGLKYNAMEQKSYDMPPFERALNIALRFSGEDERVLKQRFSEWQDEALAEGKIVNKPTI